MLKETLEAIEACDDIKRSDYLDRYDHPLLAQAEAQADAELINDAGKPNWKAMDALGFKVTRGDFDSFGWLTGVIHTSKGKLVYG